MKLRKKPFPFILLDSKALFIIFSVAGSSKFDDYVLEFPVPQPKSVKEELASCREQLKTRTADLRAANEKILGFIL